MRAAITQAPNENFRKFALPWPGDDQNVRTKGGGTTDRHPGKALFMQASSNVAHTDAPMLADISRQRSVLEGLLARRSEVVVFGQEHLAPDQGGYLYAFGSGDGWFAARAVLGSGDRTAAVPGLDFLLRIAPKLRPADRALAITMSGNVDRTLEAARAGRDRGTPVSLLTNKDGGRLGALGVPALRLQLDDLAPFLCGTSNYTATLAALGMARDVDGAFDQAIEAVLPHLDGLIQQADGLAAEIASAIGPQCSGIRFLSTGAGLATADYAAAKFVEVTTLPSWSDDIEEFAHRQYWTLKRSELVVFLAEDHRSAEFANASAEALAEFGTPTLIVAPEHANANAARFHLTVPGEARTACITQAIVAQLLAYRLALATGTDPNRRNHLKADTVRFAVSRKLTRRSLLGTGQ
jgi:glucosamine 6-phosphate synthetase-like amidotransferase/phosphosugar isomerase protein